MKRGSLLILFLFNTLFFLPYSIHAEMRIWANDGGDKVTQDELRATTHQEQTINSVWDGNKIRIFGARNEVISFNLVIEAPEKAAHGVEITFNRLKGPGGTEITSKAVSGNGVFDWVNRPIEVFYVRYLEIKGLSILSYNALYDERHVPKRFRRPWIDEGHASGTWEDRPDHNKRYPEIAIPIELVGRFDIAAGQNQSVWVDIYIPKTAPSGTYEGMVNVTAADGSTSSIPVEMDVLKFALPDYPTARTMLYYSQENINDRYMGVKYIDPSSENYAKSTALVNRHFLLAHRHKISLIDEYLEIDQMAPVWTDRLNGDLFTPAKGYDGPGVATGNNVYSIGTYGSWSWAWSETSRSEMWTNADAWVDWFDAHPFDTPTEYFLYLIDESDDYPQTEQWAQWMDSNPGSGKRLKSMATISSPTAWENSTPSLDIPTCALDVGITDLWENATLKLVEDTSKRFYFYNGSRPASGSFCTEDDGVALRVNGWIQYKKKIDRWFYWESTYYNNYQGGMGETDVFNRAHTYGGFDGIDSEFARGESGWNYTNGDGVLFYPGTDTRYPAQSYGIDGPFASLRLKHWRRGIQDADYLALAQAVNPEATRSIVGRMIPKVLWEYGVENEADPTYVYTDISWSDDPDQWEAARKELADIIEGAVAETGPLPEIRANGKTDDLEVSTEDQVKLGISLNCGDFCATNADWWVVELTPSGDFKYFGLAANSMIPGLLPTHQGPLIALNALDILTVTGLTVGSHIFYFAVDLNMNGSLDFDRLYYDAVAVTVE